MYFVCLFSRFIDRFAPCVLSHLATSACQFMFTHCTFTCMHTNVAVVIHVSVVGYNRQWENWAMLFIHAQLELDIWV